MSPPSRYIRYLPKTDAFRNRWVPELFHDTKAKIDRMQTQKEALLMATPQAPQ